MKPRGMLAYLKRTTVKVPDELDARLRHEAERRGTTVSEITREALEAYLGPRRRLSFTASGRSGQSDIASRIEEILEEEWGRRGPR
jgi:predicted DNA-binding protein